MMEASLLRGFPVRYFILLAMLSGPLFILYSGVPYSKTEGEKQKLQKIMLT